MRLKPIPVEYNDIPTQSTLEARWMTFFDHIKLPWHYEYQGYDLGGLWYLPDFYIPKWKCYFEAKDPGVREDASREREFEVVLEKASRLSKATGHKVIICYGGFESKLGNEMTVYTPGYNRGVLGCLHGVGTFGVCNGVDVLHLEAYEPHPIVTEAIRSLWDDLRGVLPDDECQAIAEKIWRDEEGRYPVYLRKHLIPLHSSVGFSFSMAKGEEWGGRFFLPFSDPLLCNFNAPYFDRFKPYKEAYKSAKQARFNRKDKSNNVPTPTP